MDDVAAVRKALQRVRESLTEQESVVEDQDAALIRLTEKNMGYSQAIRDIKAICRVGLEHGHADALDDILVVIEGVEWTRRG